MTQEQINELTNKSNEIQPMKQVPKELSDKDLEIYLKYTKIYDKLCADGDSFCLSFVLPDSGEAQLVYRFGKLDSPEDEESYFHKMHSIYHIMSNFISSHFYTGIKYHSDNSKSGQ